MTGSYVVIGLVAVLAIVVLAAAVRIFKHYERGVQFRLGRLKDGARGPGLIFIIPLVDRVRRVSLRIVTMPIQSQGIITRDNVSVDIAAVAYYRVKDAVRSVIAIEDVAAAINQIAQTSLRSVVGQHTLDETLAETDKINQHIREILDVQTEDWGVEVTLVELKDIQLPDSMKRVMAKQAEAEREKRAQDHRRRGRVARRWRTGQRVGHHDGPSTRAATAQPADADRDLRRQELHGRLPGAADEHDPRARGVHRPRGRERGQRPAHIVRAVRRISDKRRRNPRRPREDTRVTRDTSSRPGA